MWTEDTAGVPDQAAQGDEFGAVLLVADVVGGAEGDLVVGVPQDDAPGVVHAGLVFVLPGSPGGLTASGSVVLHQDSPHVPDPAEIGDNFGSSLAAGDLDGDGDNDLAVTSFDESVGTVARTGSVTVLPGGPSGPSGRGSRRLTEQTEGIGGVAEANDHFGGGLAVGHHLGGPEADLVVGVPNDNVGSAQEAGSVHVLPGSPSGVLTSGELWRFDAAPDDEDKLGFAAT
jgi:hypothetical protein